MRKPDTDLERRIAYYQQRGWCPARYAHLPKPIKAVIHRIGMRPSIKACYANCQRFMIGADYLNLDIDVEYREGWVVTIIPFHHAWLVWRSEIVDLTLDDMDSRDCEYITSEAYTLSEIKEAIAINQCFGPVDHAKANELYSVAIEELTRRYEQAIAGVERSYEQAQGQEIEEAETENAAQGAAGQQR